MSTPRYPTPASSSLHTENALPSPSVLDYSSKHLFPDSLDDSRNNIVTPSPLGFTPFLDDPHLKHLREFYANTPPIPPPTPIPFPTILPSSTFDPQGFFIPEGSMFPRRPTRPLSHLPSNEPSLFRRRPYDLAPSYFPTNLPTSSWKFEVGGDSHRTPLENQEDQVENILSSLDELTIDLLEKIEEGHSNRQVENQQDFSKFKDKLRQTRTQISKIQKDQMKHNNKIAFARFRITTLEKIIDDNQVLHRLDIGSPSDLNP